MLPPQHRLTDSQQIKHIFSAGKTISTPTFRLFYVHSNGDQPTQIAFVCSRKMLKKAVDRNRVKRRLREIFRAHLQTILPGYQLIILASAKALTVRTEQLATDVTQALSRTHILNPST